MSTRRLVLGAALAAAVLAAPAADADAAKKKPKGPSKSVVKRELTERYTTFAEGFLPDITKLDVQLGSLKFGKPRKGNWYQDGTPKGRKTIVFPVLVTRATVTSCNGTFSYKQTYEEGMFRFFKDDFGAWTYRGVDKTTDQESLATCPL